MTTLKEAFDLTFEIRWQGTKSERTARRCSQHVIRILGEDTDISTIRPSTFARMGKQLEEEGYAGSTINGICSALHTALTECHLEELLDHVPNFRRFKQADPIRTTYTVDEVRTLINEAPKLKQDGLLLQRSILFFYYTACRKGELMKLEWSTVDLENRRLTFVDTKNGKSHTITIHSELMPVLQEMYHERIDDGRVFPWNKDNLNYRMKTLCKRVGIGYTEGKTRDRFIHALRHSACTHLAEAGVSLRQIQALANHGSYQTTELYAHLTDKSIEVAVSSLAL